MKVKVTKLSILVFFVVSFFSLSKAQIRVNKIHSGNDIQVENPQFSNVPEEFKEPDNKSPLAIIPGGNLSGHLVIGDSPYTVIGDVNIPIGDELIIDPGVELQFNDACKLVVYGRLLAEGTAVDQITFTTSDLLNPWEGIRFSNTNTNGQDSSKLVHCIISKSSADPGGPSMNNQGGAIYFRMSSNILVKDCIMEENSALMGGGAIYFDEQSKPSFVHNILRNNSSSHGGAIYFSYSDEIIKNCIISDNESENGGACYLKGSDPLFSGVTIRNNKAKYGGAICMYGNCTPKFDTLSLCSMYGNYAYASGLAIYNFSDFNNTIEIYLDTFDVAISNEYFAYPDDGTYVFDIQNGLIEQTDQDLFISTTGSDSNSGLSALEPLKTIYMANVKSRADSIHIQTIYLEAGTYSESLTSEKMPINPRYHANLMGPETGLCILDGENVNQIMYCYEDGYLRIRKFHLINGTAEKGGAICIDSHSVPSLENLFLYDNFASENGGAIYINNYSNPKLLMVYVHDNFAGSPNHGSGGGICIKSHSSPTLDFVSVYNNSSIYTGGGIDASLYCDFECYRVEIFNNYSAHGAGLYINNYCDPYLQEMEIHHNHAVNFPGYPANGGGVDVRNHSFAIFEDANIYYNTSEVDGGGIYTKAPIKVINTRIFNNSATYSGGGIYSSLSYGSQRYISSEIYGNIASDYKGSAIYSTGSDLEFTNVTISKNSSSNSNKCLIYCHNSDINFTNSIIWGNSPSTFQVYSGGITAEYSDIQGSWSGIGNINSNPLFEDALMGNFQLQSSSPCINAGNPDTTGLLLPSMDMHRTPRINNSIVDQGANEFYTGLKICSEIFLEGAVDFYDMSPSLEGSIPLFQPFNISPWYYAGTESVSNIPEDVVDWILVEIRDAPHPFFAHDGTIVGQQAAFLQKDGTIVDIYGIPMLLMDCTLNYDPYLSIQHRNHLSVLSAEPIPEFDYWYHLDFRYDSTAAYGANAQKTLANGIFAMYAGDGNADGVINNLDVSWTWALQAGKSGYLSGDYNLNGEVDNVDKNDLTLPNFGQENHILDTVAFSCGIPYFDERDGQVYHTVVIGTQCWMAQNMNIGSMLIGGDTPTDNGVIEKYCYEDLPENCDIYGALYYRDEMMDYSMALGVQGICPDGWHIPTTDDWCILENEVDIGVIDCEDTGQLGIDAGGNLKEEGMSLWNDPNEGATNSSGFTALPSGIRWLSGGFEDLGESSYFWTSNAIGNISEVRGLQFNSAHVFSITRNKNISQGLRCMKD